MQQVWVASKSLRPAQQGSGFVTSASTTLHHQPTPGGSSPHRARQRAKVDRTRPLRRPLTRLGLAALAGIVAFGIITTGGQHTRPGLPISEIVDNLAVTFGFGISQVEITGHKFTFDASIHETLDLANVRSLLRFDSAAARQRIERLPWIETAAVTRVFPDQLRIAVTERTPLARWQRNDGMVLIDQTGRVLTSIQAGSVLHLPLVTGEGAAETAAAFLALIARHPAIAARLEATDRIDMRRWTLRLEGGPTLLLPAEGEAEALDRLAAVGVMQGIAAMSADIVDVRVPGRMIVHRGEARAPAPRTTRQFMGGENSATPAAAKEKQGAQRG